MVPVTHLCYDHELSSSRATDNFLVLLRVSRASEERWAISFREYKS
jgi:hypothetical protein